MTELSLPSWDNNAEMALLGSMLCSSKACTSSIKEIEPSDFFVNGHALIFSAIKSTANFGAVDIVTLRAQMIADQALSEAGGMEYILQVAEFVPSASNHAHYAKIVKDLKFQRDLALIASKLRSAAFDSKYATNDDRYELIEESVKALKDSFSRSSKMSSSFGELLRQVDDDLCATFTTTTETKAIYSTGFPSLDAHLSGFFPGDQVIIGGWTGDGKTAFVGESLVRSGVKHGTVSLFNSGEMKSKDVVRRIIQSRSGVSVGRMRKGDFDGEDYQDMANVMEAHHNIPVYIEEKLMKPDQLYAKAVRIKREHGRIDRIALDYIQMLNKFTKRGGVDEMDSMMYEYKDMAKDLDCSTLLLSQFNAESQKDARPPRLGDLKGSGGIAAAADVVLLLHRPNPVKTGRESASCYVAKARFGPVGRVGLDFIPDRATWVEPGEVL